MGGVGGACRSSLYPPTNNSAKKGPIFTAVFSSPLRSPTWARWAAFPSGRLTASQGGVQNPEVLLSSSLGGLPSWRQPVFTGLVIPRKDSPGGLRGPLCWRPVWRLVPSLSAWPLLWQGCWAAAGPCPFHWRDWPDPYSCSSHQQFSDMVHTYPQVSSGRVSVFI